MTLGDLLEALGERARPGVRRGERIAHHAGETVEVVAAVGDGARGRRHRPPLDDRDVVVRHVAAVDPHLRLPAAASVVVNSWILADKVAEPVGASGGDVGDDLCLAS